MGEVQREKPWSEEADDNEALLDWAKTEGLWAAHLAPADAIAKLRNSFAHPNDFNTVLTPGVALDLFKAAVEVMNHLWPLHV